MDKAGEAQVCQEHIIKFLGWVCSHGGSSAAAAMFGYFAKGVIPLIILCTLPPFAYSAVATEDLAEKTKPAEYTWKKVLDTLGAERDQLSMQLKEARDILLVRAQKENPDSIAKLYLDPPRRSGYQIVPAIEDDKPLASVSPRQHSYSLETLRTRFESNLREVADFSKQVSAKPAQALVPLVSEFEQLRGQFHSLESHLAYHTNWQQSVVDYDAFFAKRNRIAATVGEWQQAQASNKPVEHVATLKQTVQDSVTNFRLFF